MSWLAIGLLCCALAVVAGAFGAHGLKARLNADSLALWETAARYLIYGGFGLALLGLASHAVAKPLTAAGGLLLVGTLVFSFTVFALALGGPRWLGAITPIGGTLMILGFVLFALAAWRG
jgi:uncharacterized membrane protein YgdD (TMEM256/DUF423 family)